jgi:hypothetical protein
MQVAVNAASGTVTVVDTATREPICLTACAGVGPFDVVLDTFADRAYITGYTDRAVAVVDLDTIDVTEDVKLLVH